MIVWSSKIFKERPKGLWWSLGPDSSDHSLLLFTWNAFSLEILTEHVHYGGKCTDSCGRYRDGVEAVPLLGAYTVANEY